jgi:hypothetical protein
MKISYNDKVWVRFTKRGVAARRKYYERVTRATIPVQTHDPPEIWVEIALWRLMAELGHALKIGSPPLLVDGEIHLTDPRDASSTK